MRCMASGRWRQIAARYALWILRILVCSGAVALGALWSLWWCPPFGPMLAPWLVIILGVVTIYTIPQVLGNWALYLAAREPPPAPKPSPRLTVDVFVTACDEPPALVERSLAAACAMEGPSRVWLLDDGADPALAQVARRLGAGYLARATRRHAKAGNINAALPKTYGDLIAIFDVDHVPTPDFLTRTIGHFTDPAIGAVQVMITFSNEGQSWTARAAVESSLDYYNPVALGTATIGGVSLMGSNAILRRAALESIGGYQPGLAEDLATSVALHAAGWRTAYVPEPLAPGLAPADLDGWFTQQLKWSRGVFELLLSAYPRFFRRLTWGQRLSYLVRMTYYLIGPVAALHLSLTVAALFGPPAFQVEFGRYLLFLLPVAALMLLIRQTALRFWRHRTLRLGMLWRALALIYTTWPVYTLAWVMALLRLPLAFRPTPKHERISGGGGWLVPQIGTTLLLGWGLLFDFLVHGGPHAPVVWAFALGQGASQALVLGRWLWGWHRRVAATARRRLPWCVALSLFRRR